MTRGKEPVFATPLIWTRELWSILKVPLRPFLAVPTTVVRPITCWTENSGEIFVVRVAGKVPGPAAVGSPEYAVEHLRVPLLLVPGHVGCGAGKAAMEGIDDRALGALNELIREIEPAVRPDPGPG